MEEEHQVQRPTSVMDFVFEKVQNFANLILDSGRLPAWLRDKHTVFLQAQAFADILKADPVMAAKWADAEDIMIEAAEGMGEMVNMEKLLEQAGLALDESKIKASVAIQCADLLMLMEDTFHDKEIPRKKALKISMYMGLLGTLAVEGTL